MSQKQDKGPINVVDIADSDDEALVADSSTPERRSTTNATSASAYQTLESRSFWKAGNFDIGPTKWAPAQGQLEHARVHPKFLHSNATSHKWAFGAIAELMDNAVDEICNGATFVKVDKIFNRKDNSPALLFQDDGGGMDPECMRKCMSLGYSSKTSNSTIGQYGNGFKTSTMRLGADVIVFSRSSKNSRATQSIGLLSYTYLRKTGQDDVIVPMVDFNIYNHRAEPIIYSSLDDWSANLNTILEWSPYASKDELLRQCEDIGPHGTKVIIFNLWLNDEGIFELNFDDNEEDIMLRDEARSSSKTTKKIQELQSHISYRMRFSLQAYASMLYLRKFTNFQILLRGKQVEQFNIDDELRHRKVVTYKPHHSTMPNEASVAISIGFIKEAPNLSVSGFNVYHKNRLIRPFWKVKSDGSSKGNGVVGVLEANFIEPAHDKQDFERSSLYIRLETKLKQMVADFWKGHCHLIGFQPTDPVLLKIYKEGAAQSLKGDVSGAYNQVQGGQHSTVPAADLEQNYGGIPSTRSMVGPPPGFGPDEAAIDNSRSNSIDQICKENIQLFMRCEEHKKKENEMKNTVELLEKQLEETRKKCAQLAAHLERRKKQNLLQRGFTN